MQPHVARITELDPRRRRIHVVGEVHPGELENRGYAMLGAEWVKEITRPKQGVADADPFLNEFSALLALGYAFREGDEWSPAELFRQYQDRGLLKGSATFVSGGPS